MTATTVRTRRVLVQGPSTLLISCALLLLFFGATRGSWAQAVASPFDMVGLIQSASVDTPGNPLSGGSIKINNHVVKIPANSIVQMPASALGWGEVFSLAP